MYGILVVKLKRLSQKQKIRVKKVSAIAAGLTHLALY
jgi:hypothetical protein